MNQFPQQNQGQQFPQNQGQQFPQQQNPQGQYPQQGQQNAGPMSVIPQSAMKIERGLAISQRVGTKGCLQVGEQLWGQIVSGKFSNVKSFETKKTVYDEDGNPKRSLCLVIKMIASTHGRALGEEHYIFLSGGKLEDFEAAGIGVGDNWGLTVIHQDQTHKGTYFKFDQSCERVSNNPPLRDTINDTTMTAAQDDTGGSAPGYAGQNVPPANNQGQQNGQGQGQVATPPPQQQQFPQNTMAGNNGNGTPAGNPVGNGFPQSPPAGQNPTNPFDPYQNGQGQGQGAPPQQFPPNGQNNQQGFPQ